MTTIGFDVACGESVEEDDGGAIAGIGGVEFAAEVGDPLGLGSGDGAGVAWGVTA
jgi:hypothetical protein